MENICLTFVSPHVIQGDKSLINVIAHEISHSWTGNLVSIANWDNFWVKDGFTRFLEMKVMEKMKGKKYVQLVDHIKYRNLVNYIRRIGIKSKMSKLNPRLSNVLIIINR
jgi:leukotriene-A4 hydrolase